MWIQTELVFTLAKNATKPNTFEIIPLQTIRKEKNWKTEEALARAAVSLETGRIKGSNPWCWWWWWRLLHIAHYIYEFFVIIRMNIDYFLSKQWHPVRRCEKKQCVIYVEGQFINISYGNIMPPSIKAKYVYFFIFNIFYSIFIQECSLAYTSLLKNSVGLLYVESRASLRRVSGIFTHRVGLLYAQSRASLRRVSGIFTHRVGLLYVECRTSLRTESSFFT